MKVLLAIDGSLSSEATLQALTATVRPQGQKSVSYMWSSFGPFTFTARNGTVSSPSHAGQCGPGQRK